MAASSETLAQLRRKLAERFPTAHRVTGRTMPAGLPALDELTGGLPLAAVTEVVCSAPSCGSQLLFGQLLAATRATLTRVALVDASDQFDPGSLPADQLAHLIWVRCASLATALGATDLLARDANLGLVVLDVRHVAPKELHRIPGPQWYRLQRAVEPTDLALVILTPGACVASAQLRLELSRSLGAGALAGERPGLAAGLAPALQRQRRQIASAG